MNNAYKCRDIVHPQHFTLGMLYGVQNVNLILFCTQVSMGEQRHMDYPCQSSQGITNYVSS